jgi:hypothetical protein
MGGGGPPCRLGHRVQAMTAQAPHGLAAMARSVRLESEAARPDRDIKPSGAALIAARLEL